MKKFLSLAVSVCVIIVLSACIGEDYDAGPPEAKLSVTEDVFSLKEANVDWKTEEKKYNKEVKDIIALGNKQKEIELSSNQKAELIFQENKDNGGDYTDETVKVSLWNGEKETELKTKDNTFTTPTEPGTYILAVEFSTQRNGSSQYVGNIVVK